MNGYDYRIKTIQTDMPADRQLVEQFLSARGLVYDRDVSYTLLIQKGQKIIATGSLAGNVLKCIAVDADYQGEALTNKIVTYLELEAYHKGIERLFVFTKHDNSRLFQSLGFGLVAQTEGEQGVALLEKPDGEIDMWLQRLAAERSNVPTTALVMNCNPFTLGHRYLVERAAERAAQKKHYVQLFVVSEEKSLFPEAVRFDLVKRGTADLENVTVHHGGPYIISGATFPTYFLRDDERVTAAHARLDLQVFGERIAPALNITRRMVGEEPYCPVTSAYNQQMQQVLPEYGIEVEVIPRLTHEGTAVSASSVRELIRNGRLAEVRELVPTVTWEYLNSEEAQPVIERIKREKRRH